MNDLIKLPEGSYVSAAAVYGVFIREADEKNPCRVVIRSAGDEYTVIEVADKAAAQRLCGEIAQQMDRSEDRLEILADMANELSDQAGNAGDPLLIDIEPEEVLDAVLQGMNALLYHDSDYRQRFMPEANHLGEFLSARFLTGKPAPAEETATIL